VHADLSGTLPCGVGFCPRRVRPRGSRVLRMLFWLRIVRRQRHGLYRPMPSVQGPTGPWSRRSHNWQCPGQASARILHGIAITTDEHGGTGPNQDQPSRPLSEYRQRSLGKPARFAVTDSAQFARFKAPIQKHSRTLKQTQRTIAKYPDPDASTDRNCYYPTCFWEQ
jgi:hypothetical protein